MAIRIQPIAEETIDGFRAALDSVAKERRYLLFTEAPPRERTVEFVRDNLAGDIAQFVAIDDQNDEVVGWCDVLPMPHPGTTHTGHLGMGVIVDYRGQGVGRRLIEATIAKAFSKGISRIELEVFSSNPRAIALYEKFGFEHEGIKRRARCLDDQWDDFIVMALIRDDD